MTDWVDEEIAQAKTRCLKAARKFDRRVLNEQAKQQQRPGIWIALVKNIRESVERFNADPDTGSPFTFTEKTNNLIYVSTGDYPLITFHAEFREHMNDIVFSGNCRELTASGDNSILSGSVVFDVDDDGNVILLYYKHLLTIEELTATMLRPLFQKIC